MDTFLPIVDLTLKELIAGGRVKYDAGFHPTTPIYRHWLSRTWDEARPYANFLMLNPSTATHLEDDPTVFRTMNYAFDWGYGGVWVTNIFDYRDTDPEKMKAHPEPYSEANDAWIVHVARGAGIVVCAWGIDGDFGDRGTHVLALLRRNWITPHCLTKTKTGQPGHPLYLKKTLRPVPLLP